MIDKLVRDIDLESQYKGFYICFWTMLVLAVFVVNINLVVGILLAILGLGSGAISQLKVTQINQMKFLANQETFLNNQESFKEYQVEIIDRLEALHETLHGATSNDSKA